MDSKGKRGLSPSKSRSTGMKGPKRAANRARPTSTRNTKPPQLPGEKSVRETRDTLDVKPVRPTKVARNPLDPGAIDRRRQILEG